MADVTRALLLPDVRAPSDLTLLTLALYWDELILPDYRERYLKGGGEHATRSHDFEALEQAGVVLVSDRQIDLNDLVPFEIRRVAESYGVVLRVSDAMMEQLRQSELEPIDVDDVEDAFVVDLDHGSARDVVASHVATHLLDRLDDATELAQREHLAPVACSRLSHLASLLGAADAELPSEEAALLSVAAASFRPDASTTAEQVLAFRERTRASRARFRASLGDLSEELQGEGNPEALLARARDRYRNQVIPALSDLEGVLKENRISFTIHSLTRATAVTFAPVKPMTAATAGVQIAAETLNYAFSKKKLIREHPYGYLHELAELEGEAAEPFRHMLSEDDDGDAAVRRLILGEGMPALVEHFMGKLPKGPAPGSAQQRRPADGDQRD